MYRQRRDGPVRLSKDPGEGREDILPPARRKDIFAISFRLPGGLSAPAESTCQNLLTGLMLYLTQLHDEYPENIEVMEE